MGRKKEQWSTSKKASLPSSTTKCDFAIDCLHCGKSTRDQRKKDDVSVYHVRSSSCQANLELLCLQRGPGDKWPETVKGRIEYAQDLYAADAVYHQQCNINFRTGRNISWAFQSHGSDGENKKGRPEHEDRLSAFFKVISCAKNLMREYLGGEESYSKEHMKRKLLKT